MLPACPQVVQQALSRLMYYNSCKRQPIGSSRAAIAAEPLAQQQQQAPWCIAVCQLWVQAAHICSIIREQSWL